MEFIKSTFNEKLNFTPELQPLFDAMKDGKTIKKVVCMAGNVNKDNPQNDFSIENFTAEYYTVALCRNGNTGKLCDYVDTSDGKSFYMDWVRSFEL